MKKTEELFSEEENKLTEVENLEEDIATENLDKSEEEYLEEYKKIAAETLKKIINLSIDKDTYKSGEVIKVKAIVKDKLEFEHVLTVGFFNKKSTDSLHARITDFRQLEDGTYEGYSEIQLENILFDQEYVIGRISLSFADGPFPLYYIGETEEPLNFNVEFKTEGTEGVSTIVPEIVELNIDKNYKDENSGHKIKFSTEIKSKYELANAYLTFKNVDTGNINEEYSFGFYDFQINSSGQYVGTYILDEAEFNDSWKSYSNGKYSLNLVRIEDIYGNYTILHEEDLINFSEEFNFEVLNAESQIQYDGELVNITLDKEYYQPSDQIEVTIEMKIQQDINGFSFLLSDRDQRYGFDTSGFFEGDFERNSVGNYVIRKTIKAPYFFENASYYLRNVDAFYSTVEDFRKYDYNLKIGEEFLYPIFHVRYQEESNIEKNLETKTELVAYETQYVENNLLNAGEERIITPGVNGEREIIEEITYIDGVVSNRKVISTSTTREAVTQVIERGTRIEEVKAETRTDKIAFETTYKDNASLELGTEKETTAGIDGVRTIVETVTYVNGKEIKRLVASSEVTKAPVTRVVERGTKVTQVKTETRNEVLAYDRIYNNNPDLKIGIENIITEGVNGIVSITEEVTYVNGIVQSRKITKQVVTAEAVSEVIERGAKGVLVVSETTKEPVSFDIEYIDNANLENGLLNTLTPGFAGERTITEEVTYVNGIETSRIETSNEITHAPTTQIVERGTKVIEIKVETRTEDIPFDTIYEENTELSEGETNILLPGVVGSRTVVEEVTYVDGIVTSRVIISSEITTEAIAQLVEIAVPVADTPTEQPEKPVHEEGTETSYTDYPEADIVQAGVAMLPATGEKENFVLFSAASLSILAGLGLIASAKKKED